MNITENTKIKAGQVKINGRPRNYVAAVTPKALLGSRDVLVEVVVYNSFGSIVDSLTRVEKVSANMPTLRDAITKVVKTYKAVEEGRACDICETILKHNQHVDNVCASCHDSMIEGAS